jgi:hypothetical protein
VIPDLETSDVHLKGSPTKIQRGPFHQQLGLREDRVASVARFAVAWSTPSRSDAVMRQATVMELAPDEEAKSFLVHRRPLGCWAAVQRQIHRGPSVRRRQPVRPGAGVRRVAQVAKPRPEKKPPPATQTPDERGWRATFYTTGVEHSPTSATGSAWERTPWRAVQGAARDALMKGESRT